MRNEGNESEHLTTRMRGIGTTGNNKEKEGHSQGARMKRVRVKCEGEEIGMRIEVDRKAKEVDEKANVQRQ